VKLDKQAIKDIAKNRFHDKEYKSMADLILHAVEVWLSENRLVIDSSARASFNEIIKEHDELLKRLNLRRLCRQKPLRNQNHRLQHRRLH
jgi:hypothetical protein